MRDGCVMRAAVQSWEKNVVWWVREKEGSVSGFLE